MWFTHIGVKRGAVVLVVVGAVHGPVSHGDDPRAQGSVLWLVGLLGWENRAVKTCVPHGALLFAEDTRVLQQKMEIGRFTLERETG